VAFLLERTVTKEEVIRAIRACTRKLGRIPTKKELRELTGITEKRVSNRFGSLGQAIRAAGLEPRGPGYQLKIDTVLKDWAAVARKLGKLPSKNEYTAHGRHSTVPFDSRWKSWKDVPLRFRHWTGETGVEDEWSDVLALVDQRQPVVSGWQEEAVSRQHSAFSQNDGFALSGKQIQRNKKDGKNPNARNAPRRGAGRPAQAGTFARRALKGQGEILPPKRPLMAGRTVYGPLLLAPGLVHEPMDELGVVYVFGMVAYRMGFAVLRTQMTFPDCEAIREIQPGKWQRVRIEFEYESRNFVKHGHNKDECDLIVCWRHNWAECPKELEVVELRKVVKEML
jgi:Homing endonuclease associated repeat